MLEFDGDVVKELRVRTCLARNFNARNGLGLTPEAMGVTGDPPGSFGGGDNLGKQKAAFLP